jgi:hypothetical protein
MHAQRTGNEIVFSILSPSAQASAAFGVKNVEGHGGKRNSKTQLQSRFSNLEFGFGEFRFRLEFWEFARFGVAVSIFFGPNRGRNAPRDETNRNRNSIF